MDLQKKSPGFRVEISEVDFLGADCKHYTGVGNVTSAVRCECPNCGNIMFPAMNFGFPDENLESIIAWSYPVLHILFCPFCAFYMEPYWIRHTKAGVAVMGGCRDGGEVLQDIETPYLCREISLKPLVAEDYPIDPERIECLLSRKREPGVYHQIGGMPIKGCNENLKCCDCSREMKFAGILDYDDLNVPLYENNHSPVSLIIGDYDSLNIYLCEECSVVGLSWSR